MRAHIETAVAAAVSAFCGLVVAAVVPALYPGITGSDLAYHRFWFWALGYAVTFGACGWLLMREDRR